MPALESFAHFSRYVSGTCVCGHLHRAGLLDLYGGVWITQNSSFGEAFTASGRVCGLWCTYFLIQIRSVREGQGRGCRREM